MTKMGQKLIKKIVQNCVVFLYIFRIYSLKIFAVGGLGVHGPQEPPPLSTSLIGLSQGSAICTQTDAHNIISTSVHSVGGSCNNTGAINNNNTLNNTWVCCLVKTWWWWCMAYLLDLLAALVISQLNCISCNLEFVFVMLFVYLKPFVLVNVFSFIIPASQIIIWLSMLNIKFYKHSIL